MFRVDLHKGTRDLKSNKYLVLLQPVNDVDFHPQNPILISGAKDNTIKYDANKIIVP